MSGIYLHIPFCRQACFYCDFHFSTNHKSKQDVLDAMERELELQQVIPNGEVLNTIYFGGGTPSLLSAAEINRIIEKIGQQFSIAPDAEITLESNPDDLTSAYIRELRTTPVNRLSIGIQSFREHDLQLMNRAHDAAQALHCVPDAAAAGFDNITIDLIYGIPGLDMAEWQQNVETALSLPVQHLSCYALTVEEKTALDYQIRKGAIAAPDDDLASDQYDWLLHRTEAAGMPWYEVSNFARPGYESKHNSAYWRGVHYLGIGPSAHSFNGVSRSWNVKSNAAYVQQLREGILPVTPEILTREMQFNEYLLTSLRTRHGLSVTHIRNQFGDAAATQLLANLEQALQLGQVAIDGDRIAITAAGLHFADAIAANCFML